MNIRSRRAFTSWFGQAFSMHLHAFGPSVPSPVRAVPSTAIAAAVLPASLFGALLLAGTAILPWTAHAQTPAAPAVCPAPGEPVPAGHRIRCVLAQDAAGDVEIDTAEATIEAGEQGSGIEGRHDGDGDVRVAVRSSRVTTAGHWTETERAHGIAAAARTGSVEVTLRDVDIETLGTAAAAPDARAAAIGVVAQRSEGAGRVTVDVSGGRVVTHGRGSHGFAASGPGDMAIRVRDATVSVNGNRSRGLVGSLDGGSEGSVEIDVRNATVTTHGSRSSGLVGGVIDGSEGSVGIRVQDAVVTTEGERSHGLYGAIGPGSSGDVGIDVDGSTVTAKGERSDGVYAAVVGEGESRGSIDIDIRDTTVTTLGVMGDGVFGSVYGGSPGDVEIALRNVDIETRSTALDEHGNTYANGVVGHIFQSGTAEGEPVHDVSIRTEGGSIVTHGVLSRGIQAQHASGDGGNRGDIRIATAGTRIETRGADADGILAYHTGQGGIDIGIDGGRIDAAGDGSNGIRVGQVSAEGVRSARTGAAGAVERAAPVGADGYRRQTVTVDAPVTGGTGLAAGVFLAGGGRVVVGPQGRLGAGSGIAIFSAGDTTVDGEEVPRRLRVDLLPDGHPPSDLLDGVIRNDGGETVLTVNGVTLLDSDAGGRQRAWAPNGARDVTLADDVAGLDFSTPESFVDRYAPRAAVYEALPSVLLRLDGGGSAGQRLRLPDAPGWVEISGGTGSYGPDGASVGASYDFGRFETEAGLDFPLIPAESLSGWVSLRQVRGSADVAAPTGGGRIEAEGIGAAFGASWSNDAGYYADGHVSAMRYEVGMRSDERGQLKQGATPTVRAFGVEAGRRLAIGERVHLTPRARLTGSDVAMGRFVDSVGARVSLEEAARFAAGIGVVAETARAWNGGESTLFLRGELGVERALGDARTVVDVSGERLGSEPSRNRAVLGLSAVYRRDGYSLGGEVFASGSGSDDREVIGSLRFGIRF